MRKIVFCSKCGYFGSIGEEMDDTCPKCKIPLVSTSISKEEWDALSKEEKDELKKLLLERKRGSALSVKELADREDYTKGIAGQDNTQNNILKGIASDLHFIKTVVLVGVILTVLPLIIGLFCLIMI